MLLALARGAPIKALGMANDGIIAKRDEFFQAWQSLVKGSGEPATVAEAWAKFSCETLIDWMTSWTMDMIRLRAAPHSRAINNDDLNERLRSTAGKLQPRDLFGHLDRLNAARKMLAGQINRQLLLEDALIHWHLCQTLAIRR